MECEKARDRFSSLYEKELTPFEENVVKEHLSSCPECQREFEQFEKTMRWLHSVGEVEVPGGFLAELYKKMEEREKITSAEKSRGGWFNFPLPFKLPVQAAAMVTIVFLVLYLTKMMPLGGYHPKETGQPSLPLSVEKKSEKVLVQKEMEREPRALETTPRAPRTKNVEQAEFPDQGEEKLKGAYSPGPPREIVLKISDRDKAISQLRELVKQFKGEIVTTEGNRFFAFLPTSSFSKFEKELIGVSSTGQTDKGTTRKHATGSLRAFQGVKKEGLEGKSRETAKLATDEESRIVVRILLVQE